MGFNSGFKGLTCTESILHTLLFLQHVATHHTFRHKGVFTDNGPLEGIMITTTKTPWWWYVCCAETCCGTGNVWRIYLLHVKLDIQANLVGYFLCSYRNDYEEYNFGDVLPYILAEVYRHFRGSDVVGLSKMSVEFYQTTRHHIRCNNVHDCWDIRNNHKQEFGQERCKKFHLTIWYSSVKRYGVTAHKTKTLFRNSGIKAV